MARSFTAPHRSFGHPTPRQALHAMCVLFWALTLCGCTSNPVDEPAPRSRAGRRHVEYQPRERIDMTGFLTANEYITPWKPTATLEEIAAAFHELGERGIAQIDQQISDPKTPFGVRAAGMLRRAALCNYRGQPEEAYATLLQARDLIQKNDALSRDLLYTCIMFQGVCALRQGENDNCILCRGESSCILPISRAAQHTNRKGSELAIEHFTEYLSQFPDDLEVKWLLNLAHMTLGQYPDKVDPRYVLNIDTYQQPAASAGRFRDIGEQLGLNNFNQAGGAIMEDFDNDGWLDIAITSFDPLAAMHLYRNNGRGKFEDQTSAAGLAGQWGGLNAMQTDYNNDGFADIFIVRGAWMTLPMRPSLLKNNQNGTFTDVTAEAGLLNPANSIAAAWHDYDNDGWLDVFVCDENTASRLYRNQRDGTFADVTEATGLYQEKPKGKGAAWIDYNNDGHVDLFVNYYSPDNPAQLFRNNGNSSFVDATRELGIQGPTYGFSCWAWDYNNDGWQDLWATSYDRQLAAVVQGLIGEPHDLNHGRLYLNRQGAGFEDQSRAAGLDQVYATMGSNFSDFNNDGYLDMYLGTGEPELTMLVPNRMFQNMEGQKFAEITSATGTGNLQKGHGVACGDWDRDGDNDIFIEMGGALPGDKYHNVMFQNPGPARSWLRLKLIGQKTNRAAIGARLKLVTAGSKPLTIYRHISSGSSFGANSLQQTIGLADAESVAELEITWPVSGTTQRFTNLQVNQTLEITELSDQYRTLDWKPLPEQVSPR